jgi:hypothetical protein
MHGPALFTPRPGGGPVFVDPHGHRVRRLRHGARVAACAAAVYLALLGLGIAGPAAPPFSLFPGAGAKAGESGTEAVHTGSAAVQADQFVNPAAVAAALQSEVLDPTAAVANPDPSASPGPAAPAGPAPVGATPAATIPTGAPSSTPRATPAPAGRSGAPSGGAPGARPTPSQGASPPAATHVPPGQAKKAGGPGASPGNGNGNGPPNNHGQQMAAEHSHSPNH